MPHIIQHSYNFFSSRTPKPELLTAKLEGTGTNPRPRISSQNRIKQNLFRVFKVSIGIFSVAGYG